MFFRSVGTHVTDHTVSQPGGSQYEKLGITDNTDTCELWKSKRITYSYRIRVREISPAKSEDREVLDGAQDDYFPSNRSPVCEKLHMKAR
jgi:hypothetical protein